MSRARPLIIALGLALAGLAPADAADYRGSAQTRGRDAGRIAGGPGMTCHGPYIETARFKEQVCRMGVAGYAECHWVSREHDVSVPEHCEAKYTAEDTTPAKRGAFPPYPYR